MMEIFLLLFYYFFIISDIYSSSELLFFLTKITAPNTINRIQIPMMIMIAGFHASLLALSAFDAGIVVLSLSFPLSFQVCQSIAGLEVFSSGAFDPEAFLESYFASTTEILISFSVSLRSNAPPSATLTRSSYSAPAESVSTALPASSVIDHSSLLTSANVPSAP